MVLWLLVMGWVSASPRLIVQQYLLNPLSQEAKRIQKQMASELSYPAMHVAWLNWFQGLPPQHDIEQTLAEFQRLRGKLGWSEKSCREITLILRDEAAQFTESRLEALERKIQALQLETALIDVSLQEYERYLSQDLRDGYVKRAIQIKSEVAVYEKTLERDRDKARLFRLLDFTEDSSLTPLAQIPTPRDLKILKRIVKLHERYFEVKKIFLGMLNYIPKDSEAIHMELGQIAESIQIQSATDRLVGLYQTFIFYIAGDLPPASASFRSWWLRHLWPRTYKTEREAEELKWAQRRILQYLDGHVHIALAALHQSYCAARLLSAVE